MLDSDRFPRGRLNDNTGQEMAENKEFRFRASLYTHKCTSKSVQRHRRPVANVVARMEIYGRNKETSESEGENATQLRGEKATFS